MAVPDNDTHVLGQCAYDELRLTGAIKKDNVTGLQFHPERSGPAGLEVLRNFIFPWPEFSHGHFSISITESVYATKSS